MPADQPGSVLQRTNVSQRVVTLRERLLRAGASASYLNPADVHHPARFDDHVDAAVRAFQQSRGLIVDGRVGQQTDRALSEAQFKLGDRSLAYDKDSSFAPRGEDVSELQRQLSHLGFYHGHIDGEYGRPTQAAVRDLQRNVGLPITGTSDGPLISALARVNRSMSSSSAFSLRDYERLNEASAALAGRVVVLDPGVRSDSPSDTGPAGHAHEEHAITSDVARRAAAILDRFGVAAILTRQEGESASEAGRIKRIRSSRASLSISLYCDWLSNPLAAGVSTFYWGLDETNDVRSPVGQRLGQLIQNEIVARTGVVDLGVHPRSWDILRFTSVPSVQLDLGYLSNPDDASRLSDDSSKQLIAEALVIAVQRLYLMDDDDLPTGSLEVQDVQSLNVDSLYSS